MESDDLAPSHGLIEQLATILHVPPELVAEFTTFARGRPSDFLARSALSKTTAQPSSEPDTPLPQPTSREYHLPAPLTALVGRERELQRGVALLRRPTVRLATLIGPPGAGKTRLSLALAEELKADFPHGACFVALEPINDPAWALPAIAHALQVHESPGVSLARSVHDFLRHKRLLLILDNFEQVMGAAPLVADLLAAAPQVKAIVSSREALKIYGEYEFPVPPLAVPDINRLSAADLLEMYPAVELFVQRGQAVRPDFVVDEHNAKAIAHICAWLDGLPLAIEMAASAIKWQTPASLLEQLRQQLLSLTGGVRNLTPRLQTLRGAIDWSFHLLDDEEQRTFVALAVFSGGCTVEHAAALMGVNPSAAELILRGLVEKSLLERQMNGQEPMRFSMLHTMREYALAKLVEQGDLNHKQERHAAIYSDFVTERFARIGTADAEASLNQMEAEHNNLRSALAWYAEADTVGGLRLAVMLAESLWGIRGYFSEGRIWLEKLLDAAARRTSEQVIPAGSVAAWLAAARMAIGQGDLAVAGDFAQNAMMLAIESEEDADVRAALRCCAVVALHQSDYTQASALYQQALDLCRLDTDQKEAAAILNGLGLIAKDLGEYQQALAHHERSRALSASLADVIGECRALTYSSIAAYWQGDFLHCIELAEKCIEMQRGLGDVTSIAYSLDILAMALVRLGRLEEGVAILRECLDRFHHVNDRSGVAVTLVDLGQAFFARKEYNASLDCHRQALTIAYEIGDRRRIAFALEGIAMALARLGTTEDDEATLRQAVVLCAAAYLRQTIGAPLPQIERADYEACYAAASTRLAPALFEAAWREGSQLTLDRLIAS